MDIFLFRNTKTDQERKGTLINVSLYDDVIVKEGGEELKILHMLTKG
jgi:hypothetical protein